MVHTIRIEQADNIDKKAEVEKGVKTGLNQVYFLVVVVFCHVNATEKVSKPHFKTWSFFMRIFSLIFSIKPKIDFFK